MKRDVIAVDAKLKAVAVILDFMNPFRPLWRMGAKRRIAEFDIAGKFRFYRTLIRNVIHAALSAHTVASSGTPR